MLQLLWSWKKMWRRCSRKHHSGNISVTNGMWEVDAVATRKSQAATSWSSASNQGFRPKASEAMMFVDAASEFSILPDGSPVNIKLQFYSQRMTDVLANHLWKRKLEIRSIIAVLGVLWHRTAPQVSVQADVRPYGIETVWGKKLHRKNNTSASLTLETRFAFEWLVSPPCLGSSVITALLLIDVCVPSFVADNRKFMQPSSLGDHGHEIITAAFVDDILSLYLFNLVFSRQTVSR